MEQNQAPRSVSTHIALFGRRNAGKSSLINALTGQNIAIVSDQRGTTTDPVYKSIELFPLGPCVLIDTAGLDDTGKLGALRREKSLEVLGRTDIAVYVADAENGLAAEEEDFLQQLRQRGLPVILVWNKSDLECLPAPEGAIAVSAQTGQGMQQLIAVLSNAKPQQKAPGLLDGLVSPGELVLLVTPIDSSAPKGRLILPQQQVLRALLELPAPALVVQPEEIPAALAALAAPPALVITDSQAFACVAELLPPDMPLTSFSILFARAKGDLSELAAGARAIAALKDGDRVLIAEACTHHRQEDDIGKVKIPRWLRQKTGKELHFDFSSGLGYTKQLPEYALVVHCGACMINRAEMLSRIQQAREAEVPIVNYGVLIAYVTGILDRVLQPVPETHKKEGSYA